MPDKALANNSHDRQWAAKCGRIEHHSTMSCDMLLHKTHSTMACAKMLLILMTDAVDDAVIMQRTDLKDSRCMQLAICQGSHGSSPACSLV